MLVSRAYGAMTMPIIGLHMLLVWSRNYSTSTRTQGGGHTYFITILCVCHTQTSGLGTTSLVWALGFGGWLRYFKKHMVQGKGCTLAATYSENVQRDMLLTALSLVPHCTQSAVVRQDQVGFASGLDVWMGYFKEHMKQGRCRTLAAKPSTCSSHTKHKPVR